MRKGIELICLLCIIIPQKARMFVFISLHLSLFVRTENIIELIKGSEGFNEVLN